MSEADAEDGPHGLDATKQNERRHNFEPLDFVFHSDRFLLNRKPAPAFLPPIPIQIPPREKTRMEKRQKAEGGRAVLRAWVG